MLGLKDGMKYIEFGGEQLYRQKVVNGEIVESDSSDDENSETEGRSESAADTEGQSESTSQSEAASTTDEAENRQERSLWRRLFQMP